MHPIPASMHPIAGQLVAGIGHLRACGSVQLGAVCPCVARLATHRTQAPPGKSRCGDVRREGITSAIAWSLENRPLRARTCPYTRLGSCGVSCCNLLEYQGRPILLLVPLAAQSRPRSTPVDPAIPSAAHSSRYAAHSGGRENCLLEWYRRPGCLG